MTITTQQRKLIKNLFYWQYNKAALTLLRMRNATKEELTNFLFDPEYIAARSLAADAATINLLKILGEYSKPRQKKEKDNGHSE